MASIGEIAATLRSVVTPGMHPKEIRAAIRQRHPDASKKEIARAAFYALTETPAAGGEALADLHGFALGERGSDEGGDTGVKASRRRKKNRPTEKAGPRPAV